MSTLIRIRQNNTRSTVVRSVTVDSNLKDNAVLAMELIQQKSRSLGLDTMSLNEINDEIRHARHAK